MATNNRLNSRRAKSLRSYCIIAIVLCVLYLVSINYWLRENEEESAKSVLAKQAVPIKAAKVAEREKQIDENRKEHSSEVKIIERPADEFDMKQIEHLEDLFLGIRQIEKPPEVQLGQIEEVVVEVNWEFGGDNEDGESKMKIDIVTGGAHSKDKAVDKTLEDAELYKILKNRYENATVSDKSKSLEDVVKMLANAMLYVTKDLDKQSVESFMTLRMLEDQIRSLFRRLVQSNDSALENMSLIVIEGLYNVQESAKRLLLSANSVLSKFKDFFESFKGLYEYNVWDVYNPVRNLPIAPATTASTNAVMELFASAVDSGKCIGQMTGFRNDDSCAVDDDCWNWMTSESTTEFLATRQVLFFLAGEAYRCLTEMDKFAKSQNVISYKQYTDKLCSRIYQEMLYELKSETVSKLILDQVLVCGLAGFREFCPVEILQNMLSQQSPEGCYKEDLTKLYYKPPQERAPNVCSSLYTASAMGAAMQFVRYLTEDQQLPSLPKSV